MSKHEDLKAKFPYLEGLIFSFNPNICGTKKGREIVEGFLSLLKDSDMEKPIAQGHKFLTLDRLPTDWIRTISGGAQPSLIESGIERVLKPTEENYRIWIKWMIEEMNIAIKRYELNKAQTIRDRILGDKFVYIERLLGDFNSDLCGSKKDKEVVADFVKELDSLDVKEALEQGHQFLALDELPMKWINNLCQRFPCLVEGDNEHILESTEENYRIWIKWMIEEIEREAKRQGKL